MGERPYIVDALATYRLTRLVTKDQLTARLREAVIRAVYTRNGAVTTAGDDFTDYLNPDVWVDHVENDPDAPSLAYLITCPWCAGFWLAAGVVLARRWFPRLWGPVAEALALSAVAGLVAERLDAG